MTKEINLLKDHVLVTGGTGFIGAILNNILKEAGYKVTSVSRSSTGIENHFVLDLVDKEKVVNFINKLEPISTIIHCAAIAHGERPPKNFRLQNLTPSLLKT